MCKFIYELDDLNLLNDQIWVSETIDHDGVSLDWLVYGLYLTLRSHDGVQMHARICIADVDGASIERTLTALIVSSPLAYALCIELFQKRSA